MAASKSKSKPKPDPRIAELEGDLERAQYALAILHKKANVRSTLTPADVSEAITQARVDPQRIVELSAGV